ncbi:MAG TPA: polymer-forming cytoskeletal protein [Vicinamibacterales bacterium]|nr:polymer-forming cytoskeletal protein [Vicinamibacterales bacterium]
MLGHSILIKGDIVANEDVTIAGRVEGSIEATGHTVTLAPGSHVVGNVGAAQIEVGGRIQGGLVASDCVRVGPDGEVEGDLHTTRLAIADGGRIQGRVEMSQPRAALNAAMAG